MPSFGLLFDPASASLRGLANTALRARRAGLAARLILLACALTPALAWNAPRALGAASVDAAANAPLERFEYLKPKMGTVFRIVLYAPDRKIADAASAAAFARIDELNAILSDYDPKSEISRLSQRTLAGPMPAPVKVGDDLWRVLVASQSAAERSDGAFDVTVGPLVKLWRRSRDMGELPTADRLAEARKSVGYRLMKLDAKTHGVRLLAPRMRLDVGGIGKGYASHEALAVLRARGISRAAVGAAGDLSVGDPPPGHAGWRVAIHSLPVNLAPSTAPATAPAAMDVPDASVADEPASGRAAPDFGGAYVRLRDYGASTSSDTERFMIINGQRYSHIIDPKTGLGMTRRVGVTVIAPDDVTADWMALAVCLMGPKKGLALVDQTPGAAARMVVLESTGPRVYVSRRFADFTAAPATPAPAR